MKLADFREKLDLFGATPCVISLEFVPNAFSNGAPDHPSRLYLLVEIDYESWPIPEATEQKLTAAGWKSGDGRYWMLFF